MKANPGGKVFLAALLSVLSIFITSCNSGDRSASSNDKLKGKITISGAFALYPLTVKWAEEFHKLHPRVTINISAGGAGKGMADALSKMVELGMYSKEISPEEKAKGAWWIATAKDAVLPVMNSNCPFAASLTVTGVTKQKLYNVFITENIKTWGQLLGTGSNEELQVFTRSDACGAADMWAKFLNNKKQEDLAGVGVNGDPGVADAVRRNIYGIGYNNLNFVFDMQTRKPYLGLSVMPIDLNGNGKIDKEEAFYNNLDGVMNAINTGMYPSPPARKLYFVSAGKPVSKLVSTFLQWILTDGQKYVGEAGYVALKQEDISKELTKLQ
ncbi:MAG: PstS family phosphate ABC transporter substrate-binding protein [Bacteroidales bacterium]